MSVRRVLVVGDKFAAFSQQKDGVVTLADLEGLIWSAECSCPEEIVLGQGIEYSRLTAIINAISGQSGRDPVRVLNLEQVLDQNNPHHQRTVHKSLRSNVLISQPRRTDENEFCSWLSIQDSSELLADHVTGQHIQGMVLTEAARQMMLSVSEVHLLPADKKGKCYFVLNELHSDFSKFGFPLPTTLTFTVSSFAMSPGGPLKARAICRFDQEGGTFATVAIRFAAYEWAYISEKERALAQLAHSAQMAAVAAVGGRPEG
jgi:hypothetical protein